MAKPKAASKPKIIRTPTRAEGGITDAERAQMAEHVKLWTARAFRTAPIEPDKIIPAIKGIYAAAGLNEPRVVIAPSPMVMAFAYGASAAIWYQRTHIATRIATDSATRIATRIATDIAALSATHIATDIATDSATRIATDSATRIATDSATDSATRIATDSATLSATRIATHIATDSATRIATLSATRIAALSATHIATRIATDSATHIATHIATAEKGAAEACRHLAGTFGLECATRWGGVYQGGNMWAPWECYLTAARDILGLKLPPHDAYAHWEAAAIHGGFRVMHPEFCIVSDFPEVIRIDDQNLPHCEDGPSHRWRDGWSLYHWHGVRIPAEWVEHKERLTAKVALTWSNIEQRRAACEIVGWDRILRELDAKLIDRDEDPMIGELLEVNLPDLGRVKFLRALCGTGRTFALPVPPEMKTALEANSWTYAVDTQVLRAMEFRT